MVQKTDREVIDMILETLMEHSIDSKQILETEKRIFEAFKKISGEFKKLSNDVGAETYGYRVQHYHLQQQVDEIRVNSSGHLGFGT